MSSANPHDLDVAMGRRIRERRREIRMSQSDLAQSLGITFQQVQKYERGTNRVSFSRLMGIADALSWSLYDLTEGLDATKTVSDMARAQSLANQDGAYELLEAYAALAKPLRKAILAHATDLAELAPKTR